MDNVFFSQFLMITDVKTIIFVGVLLCVFFGIYKLAKRKVNFSIRILISMALGIALGFVVQAVAGFPSDLGTTPWVKEVIKWYGLAGNGFMDLLRMIVVPIVFISIIRVISNIQKGQSLGKLSIKTVGMLLGTTAIAAVIGIVVGNLFKLGVGVQAVQSDNAVKEITSVVDTFRGLLPSNPVKAMAEGNVVAVMIFAAFIGIAMRRLEGKYSDVIKPIKDLVEGAYKIITSVALTIIKLMPYAVVPLLANTIAGRGIESVLSVINFIIALYIAAAIMFVVHLIIVALNGLNPITYIKNVAKPLSLAFTSRSSLGTLPVTIEALSDEVGVDNGIASFVGSIGANGGMNGCAGIYPALMAVTIANMSGVHMDFSFYVMLVVITAIGSLGITGLPGTAIMSVSVVISGLGMGAAFPLAGAILAVDPILDMARTMLNVDGTMVTAVTVANSMKSIDREIFNSSKVEVNN